MCERVNIKAAEFISWKYIPQYYVHPIDIIPLASRLAVDHKLTRFN